MSLIKVSHLLDYNEALFQEGHCLVTTLLLLKKRPEVSVDTVACPTPAGDSVYPRSRLVES